MRKLGNHPGMIECRRPNNRGGGFSLVELIALMAVLSVIAAAVVPRLSSLDEGRVAMAAEQVARDIQYAKQRAVATGNTHWLVFDKSNQSWSLLGEPAGNPGRANALPVVDHVDGRDVVAQLDEGVYAGIRLKRARFDQRSEIGFDRLGRPINATGSDLRSPGLILLNTRHSITVQPETGLIEMKP